MNQINPKKLLNSKWTAVTPTKRERHFIVVKVIFDETGVEIVDCVIEAVVSNKARHIDWRDLKDASVWQLGWK